MLISPSLRRLAPCRLALHSHHAGTALLSICWGRSRSFDRRSAMPSHPPPLLLSSARGGAGAPAAAMKRAATRVRATTPLLSFGQGEAEAPTAVALPTGTTPCSRLVRAESEILLPLADAMKRAVARRACGALVEKELEAGPPISKTWTRGPADFAGSVDPRFLANILLRWMVPSTSAITKHYHIVDHPIPSLLQSPTKHYLKYSAVKPLHATVHHTSAARALGDVR
jgi:hypothetical protein